MKKLLSILVFLVSVQISFAQYEKLSFKDFMSLQKLDETITLDENFDYNLLRIAIFQYTNQHRLALKKPALSYNFVLENSAKLHCYQMNKYHFFDHINRKEIKYKDIDDRAEVVGYENYKELAENLYYGFVDLKNLPTYSVMAKTVVQALIDSKYHNLNLTNKNLKEMGVSIIFKNSTEKNYLYYYVTQSFGTQFTY